MGYLLDNWNLSQKKFTLRLKQVVAIAGDGTLETQDSINELREFYNLIDLETMGRLLVDCYTTEKSQKFDNRGFAFQDLVNEIGVRLGYTVERGLYRGKTNAIGFDGLWTDKSGNNIVVEVKTNDDYSISVNTVIGYRDALIEQRKLAKKKTSILIVYGLDNRKSLYSSVKGSNENYNIRLISAEALFRALQYLKEHNTPVVRWQIETLLRPVDCYLVDNLVNLVFPKVVDSESSVTINNEEEIIESTPSDKEAGGGAGTDNTSDKKEIEKIVEIVMDDEDIDAIDGKIGPLFIVGGDEKTMAYVLPDNHFVVLKGAPIAETPAPSCPDRIKKRREDLISAGYIENYMLKVNYVFRSANDATSVIKGQNRNAMISWKNRDDILLKNLK